LKASDFSDIVFEGYAPILVAVFLWCGLEKNFSKKGKPQTVIGSFKLLSCRSKVPNLSKAISGMEIF